MSFAFGCCSGIVPPAPRGRGVTYFIQHRTCCWSPDLSRPEGPPQKRPRREVAKVERRSSQASPSLAFNLLHLTLQFPYFVRRTYSSVFCSPLNSILRSWNIGHKLEHAASSYKLQKIPSLSLLSVHRVCYINNSMLHPHAGGGKKRGGLCLTPKTFRA